jgi:uncharacterized membrane protein YkoI
MRPSAFICLFALLLAAPAQAADSMASSSRTTDGNSASTSSATSINRDDPRDIARRLSVMPLTQAGAIALKRVPGKLLHAEIETNDGIRTWQIDIQAKDGRRVRMWLNANSGAFLKMVDR